MKNIIEQYKEVKKVDEKITLNALLIVCVLFFLPIINLLIAEKYENKKFIKYKQLYDDFVVNTKKELKNYILSGNEFKYIDKLSHDEIQDIFKVTIDKITFYTINQELFFTYKSNSTFKDLLPKLYRQVEDCISQKISHKLRKELQEMFQNNKSELDAEEQAKVIEIIRYSTLQTFSNCSTSEIYRKIIKSVKADNQQDNNLQTKENKYVENIKLDEKEHYKSYCWNCHARIDEYKSISRRYCPKCNAYHCPHCGVCKCDFWKSNKNKFRFYK